MKPGSPESIELAHALCAAIDHAEAMRRASADLIAAGRIADRYQVASLILAVLAGAAAAVAAIGWPA